MFTGIIEEVGKIKAVKRGAASAQLVVQAKTVLEDTKIGASIAVNGVCLTVTKMDGSQFHADVMNETLQRSNLGSLKVNDPINLERAMAASGRFDGHMVSGHIDGTGQIAKIIKDDIAYRYTIRADSSVLKYIVTKGSIAIDGISLTVTDVTATTFEVSIIPHTLKMTSLHHKPVGFKVNLETDIVGKYVEKTVNSRGKITKEFLMKHGF